MHAYSMCKFKYFIISRVFFVLLIHKKSRILENARFFMKVIFNLLPDYDTFFSGTEHGLSFGDAECFEERLDVAERCVYAPFAE